MPLNAVLFDRKKLIEHGNLTEALRKLLLSLHKFDAAAVDISDLQLASEVFTAEGEKLCRGKAETSGFEIPGTDRRILFSDCLVIADSESTIARAKAVNAAVLGYEPPAPASAQSFAADDMSPMSDQNAPAGSKRRLYSHLEYLVEGLP